MKRLFFGVGIAMCAIAIVAGAAGSSRPAFADGPIIELDGLDQLSGVEFGDLSDFPTEPPTSAAPESAAPAAPIEQPSIAEDAAANPQSADSVQELGAPAGETRPIALPSTGTGTADRGGALIIAGFSLVFALAGLACLGGVRALEIARTRDR